MNWLEYELLLRLGPFIAVLGAVLCWEVWAPRRQLRVKKSYRWLNNLSIALINTLVLRLIFPGAAVGVALFVQSHQWGLMNVSIASGLAVWVKVCLGVLVLDWAIWAQHWLFHKVPLLWRLHRMHHTDLDFDVTTALRFHPLEILLSMMIKAAVIGLTGIPVVAVLFFEVLLNVSAMFNHGNIRLPLRLDRYLRWFLVTPDMHRVHHSWRPQETHSNFGFSLPWWDRLFGTYRAQPVDGHRQMTIGLPQFRETRDSRFDRLLLQPFCQGEKRR